MNILVTGGNGFIGGHLVRKLREQGHNAVSMDIKIGVREDVSAPHQMFFLPQANPDAIVHLAAVSRTPEAIADPVKTYRTNVTGTLNLLEFLRTSNPSCRFVYVSSNIVYGNSNHYRASKVMAEELVRTYTLAHNLSTITLRYSNVYGPGMPWADSICLASMRRSKHENGYITLSGNGTQTRDFTHVADIVAGTIRAILHPSKSAIPVDLCTGVNTSMNQMARYFDCPIQYGPARLGDTVDIFQRPRYAKQLLDWEATIPVASGIQDVIEDVPDHYKLGRDVVCYNTESLDRVEAAL